jgi:CheY-like chemotaxis protein
LEIKNKPHICHSNRNSCKLINNSLDYSYLRTRTKVIFQVKDTGIGIKDEQKGRLFSLFGKLKQDNKEVNKYGIGLGLSISQRLVRALNDFIPDGEIKVESEFGKGSKFSFPLFTERTEKFESLNERRLDSCKIPDNLKPISSKLNNNTRKFSISNDNILAVPLISEPKSVKVLVVDDDQINLFVAINYLKSASNIKFFYQTALNGKDAVELMISNAAEGKPFDILLMDCNMPVMDGYEAAAILRDQMSKGLIPITPIIAVTANASSAERDKCLSHGMDSFISKPFKRRELFQEISDVLSGVSGEVE